MSTKILFVDDDAADFKPLIAEIFSEKIADKDYEFLFASNGLSALKTLQEHPDIEIILTDLKMPEMDGLTLLSRLPELNRPYKAIVLSAYEDVANIRSAMNKGAVDFITKPIDFEDLEITLDKTIAQCKAAKESLATKERLLGIEKELEIAKRIQQAMIPQKFELAENKGNFDIFGVVLPATQIGGDFFDFFPLDKQRIGLIIADVSGKSISASLFMAITKTLFRSIALSCATTDEALLKVSQFLSQDNPSCMFVTAFYAILDTSSGTLCFSNAGHTAPFILSTDATLKQIGHEHYNPPLGVDQSLLTFSPALSQKCLQLKDDDCLFLYTDGVTEAMNLNQEQYEAKRLSACLKKQAAKPVKELIENVLADIHCFTEGSPQSDDIAVLALRYHHKTKAAHLL